MPLLELYLFIYCKFRIVKIAKNKIAKNYHRLSNMSWIETTKFQCKRSLYESTTAS